MHHRKRIRHGVGNSLLEVVRQRRPATLRNRLFIGVGGHIYSDRFKLSYAADFWDRLQSGGPIAVVGALAGVNIAWRLIV